MSLLLVIENLFLKYLITSSSTDSEAESDLETVSSNLLTINKHELTQCEFMSFTDQLSLFILQPLKMRNNLQQFRV